MHGDKKATFLMPRRSVRRAGLCACGFLAAGKAAG
jgi:hypothetical protein